MDGRNETVKAIMLDIHPRVRMPVPWIDVIYDGYRDEPAARWRLEDGVATMWKGCNTIDGKVCPMLVPWTVLAPHNEPGEDPGYRQCRNPDTTVRKWSGF